MFWTMFWIALVLFLMAVMISHIQVKFYFKKDQIDDKMSYSVKALLGIIRLQFEVPVVKFKGIDEGVEVQTSFDTSIPAVDSDIDDHITKSKGKNFFRHMGSLKSHVHGFSEWFTRALSKIKCVELKWNTKIGIGDAPETAILTGFAWGLKTTLLGFLFRKILLHTKPDLHVAPLYNQKHFTTELTTEFKVRHFHAFMVVLGLIWRIFKIKGGIRMWIYTLYHTFLVWRNKKKQQAVNS